MKKIFWVLAVLFAIPFFSHAQDTTRQRINQRTPIQQRDRIHQQDHFLFLDGKVYRVQNGVRTEVRDRLQLQNCVINPDGSYQIRNQDKLQLRNGECLDPSGNRYASQQMFNRNKMMTQQQINRSHQQAAKQQQRANRQQQTNPPRNNPPGRAGNNRRGNN